MAVADFCSVAAKVGLFSLFYPTIKLPISPLNFHTPNTMRRQHFSVSANLGGGGDGEVKKGGKKKFITKEEEPEQYWQTAGEREGENPMKTPLPYIIIFERHVDLSGEVREWHMASLISMAI